jgi:type VII secretion-associated serine protease mycosin
MNAWCRRIVAAAAGVLLAGAVTTTASADTTRNGQWYLSTLRMAEVHRIAQGEGMTVAVLDTGVDASHPDLAGAVLPGIDAWTVTKDGRSDHGQRHGTAMAALIAGRGHGTGGADGILGVAPKAQILPVGVWPPDTKGLRGDNVAYGIRWAVGKGAHVICIAGGGTSDNAVVDAIAFARDHGIPVVAAAGNRPEDTTMSFPAYDPVAFGVGAVGRDGNHASYSVTGQALDFVAPGTDIPVPVDGARYRTSSGTSASAAIVAGVIALIRQRHPALSVKQVYNRLRLTAVDKGKPGVDEEYGWGLIEPLAALTAATLPEEQPSAAASTPTSAPLGDQPPGGSNARTVAVVAGGAGLVAVAALGGVLVIARRRRGQVG